MSDTIKVVINLKYFIVLEITIDYLVVVAAAIVSMIIGFLWHGPIFGKMWMSWMGFSPEEIQKSKQGVAMKSIVG